MGFVDVRLQDLSYRDRHWHDKCFKCGFCSTSLVNECFAFKNDQLYCAACYEQMLAPRCTRCKQVFRAGTQPQARGVCFCAVLLSFLLAARRRLSRLTFLPSTLFIYLLLRPVMGAEYCDRFVCGSVCLSMCVSMREYISRTAGPIFTNFFCADPSGRGSIVFRRCDDTLCTSG